MIAIIRHQGVTKCVESSRDRLSTIILSTLGKVKDPNQGGFRETIIDGIARAALGLSRDFLAKPDLDTARIELKPGTLGSEDLANGVGDGGIGQGAKRFDFGVLPCTLQAEQGMQDSNRGQARKGV